MPEQRLLIVTDYAPVVRRIERIVASADQPRAEAATEYYAAGNVDAQRLAAQVTQVLAARGRVRAGSGAAPAPAVELVADPRTNRLIAVGPAADVAAALAVAGKIDVPLDLETRTYRLKAASPERIDRLARELLGAAEAGRLYKSVVDPQGNLLIVTTTPAVHERVAALARDLDVPPTREQSPIRFYKLANATAADVLETIRSLVGKGDVGNVDLGRGGGAGGAGGQVDTGRTAAPPAGGPDARPGPGLVAPEVAPPPTGLLGLAGGAAAAPGAGGLGNGAGINVPPAAPGRAASLPRIYRPGQPNVQGEAGGTNGAGPGGAPAAAAQPSQAPASVRTAEATVAADVNTNTIIVVGPPAVQAVYEELIGRLDRRRPQVLVEATVITLDTSGDFSLGVEISGRGSKGSVDVLGFSSFGLSQVQGDGQLVLEPGLGFNGAVVSTDVAQLIVRALKSSGRAQVISSPRVLVNDNATGTLASVNEQPFQSINASNTVATTSFAGYSSAGTTVSLTPHISSGGTTCSWSTASASTASPARGRPRCRRRGRATRSAAR